MIKSLYRQRKKTLQTKENRQEDLTTVNKISHRKLGIPWETHVLHAAEGRTSHIWKVLEFGNKHVQPK